jgi:hypothetical protein
MKNTSFVAKARNEIKAELTNAIANKLERGTVVVSAGKSMAFTISYFTHSTLGETAKITVKGHSNYSVANAASNMLSEMGLTR